MLSQWKMAGSRALRGHGEAIAMEVWLMRRIIGLYRMFLRRLTCRSLMNWTTQWSLMSCPKGQNQFSKRVTRLKSRES